jgi:hypothetical protein
LEGDDDDEEDIGTVKFNSKLDYDSDEKQDQSSELITLDKPVKE